jgi:hypothetical protein
MATENPSNIPASDVQTANALKAQKKALETHFSVSAISNLRSSLTSKTITESIVQQLRTADGRKNWLSTMSTSLPMESSGLTLSDLSADFIVNLGKELSAQAEKILSAQNTERSSLLSNIEREYDITPTERTSIMAQIDETSGADLRSYRTITGRAKFLRTVQSFDTLPLFKSTTSRTAAIVGSEWDTLSNDAKNALTRWYGGAVIGNTQAIAVLDLLSPWAKLRLVAQTMSNWRLKKVVEVNENAFLPNSLSQESLVKKAQETLRTEILDSESRLPASVKMSEEDLQSTVASLTWSDIQDTRLNTQEILSLLSGVMTPDIFKQRVEELVDFMQRDFVSEAEDREPILQAQNSGRIRNVSAAQEQAEKYEKAPKFNTETLSNIAQKYTDLGKKFIGGEVLLDTEFTMGRRPLILKNTRSDGSEEYIEIRADREWLSTAEQIPLGLKGISFGDRLGEKGAQIRFGNPLATYLFTDSFFGPNTSTIVSTEILGQTEFLRSVSNEWPGASHEYDRVISEFEASSKENDESLAEREESGEGLRESIEQNEVPPIIPVVAGSGGGNGRGGPPPSEEIEGFDEEGEENGGFNGSLENPEDDLWDTAPVESESTQVEAPPNTQNEFEIRLGALNKGINTPLAIGHYLLLGKEGTKGFNIFRIHVIDPVLGIQFTDGLGTLEPAGGEYYSFSDLFTNLFNKRGVTAEFSTAWLSNPEDLLNFMQEKSGASVWKELKIKDHPTNGSKFLDFADREFDNEQVSKKYFIAPDGRIIEIHAIEDGQIIARLGKEFKQSTAANEPSTATWFEEPRVYSPQFIAWYLMRTGAKPWNKPDREINSNSVDEATKPGRLRAIMGRLSFHDIMSGGKKFFEEFKHHLEHGNHLQEQRVMLGMAKSMGMKWWNIEWYYDFKTKYENEEKKLIEERVETLGKMASPDRQKSIRNSLLTDGTHDYDHWTNAIAMLTKHGNLYAWELQDLEGSWIFFKRIAGIPLKGNVADYDAFQETVTKIKRKGIDNITEEAVIEEFMKTDSHFPNAQVWKMIKKSLKTWVDEEMDIGEKEASTFLTLDQKVNYAMGKLRGREYAHGIGAFKEVMISSGSNTQRQALPFMLAMSRIPERLPREVLIKLVKLFEGWQVHSPALNFVLTRSDQSLFRDVVEDLIDLKAETLPTDEGSTLRNSFAKMRQVIKTNTDTINTKGIIEAHAYKEISDFWNTHGDFLQEELTVKSNAEHRFMLDASKRARKPRLEQYLARHTGHIGDANIMEEKQVDMGTPFMQGPNGASVLMVRPDKVFDKIGLSNSLGRSEWGTLYTALQDDLFTSLDEYRGPNIDSSGRDLSASKEDQKIVFTKLFEAFCKKMESVDFRTWKKSALGIEFASIGLEPPPKIGKIAAERETRSLRRELDSVTIELGPLDIEYKQLARSPTEANAERRNFLNTRINTLASKKSELTRALNEIWLGSTTQIGKINLTDPDQLNHFQACFERFYNKQTVDAVQNSTRGGVRNLTDAREGEQSSIPASLPLDSTEWQSA